MPTFAEVDAKIEALFKEIFTLRSFRNTLSPINRLPCDILTRIFFLLQTTSADGAWCWGEDLDSAGSAGCRIPIKFRWILATHVCRQWRDFAMGCKTLWTNISCDNLRVEDWLKRSGNSVLSVTLNSGPRGSSRRVRILLEMHRIRRLTLDGYGGHLEQIHPGLFRSAPALEELLVTTISEPHIMRFSIVPFNIFSGNTPMLRSVTLQRCHFELDCAIFKDLTLLRITYPNKKISPPALIAALNAMPQLGDLDLTAALQVLPDSGPADQRLSTVDLPSLIRVNLLDVEHNVALYVLSQITFHPLAEVKVELALPPTGLAAISSLLHADARCRRALSFATSIELVLDLDSGHSPKLVVRKEPQIEIGVLLGSKAAFLEIQTQFEQLPLTNLVSMDIDGPINPTLWKTGLCQLPNLHEVVLLNEGATNFLQFLSEWFSDDAIDPSESRADIFPALDLLYIWTPVNQRSEDLTTGLTAYLRSRDEKGRKLEKLFLCQGFFMSYFDSNARTRVRSDVHRLLRVSESGYISNDIADEEDLLDDD